jgi:moderate conductance mechanosensitive channel
VLAAASGALQENQGRRLPARFALSNPISNVPRDSSAGGVLLRAFRALARQVSELSPTEVAINAGLTIGVVIVALALNWFLDWLLRRGAEQLAQKGLMEARRPKTGQRVAAVSRYLLKGAIIFAAANVAMQVWGFAPLAWLSGRDSAWALRIVVLMVVGAGALEISGQTTDRIFRNLAAHSADVRRAHQFNTLRPIVGGLVDSGLVLFVGLTLLSEFGVQIAPLLAGAGVMGVALGFGAQTLVKDFITGLFLIIEDIVSVGDSVMIGGFAGLVESMSLRTIRVRDFDGTLHVFPYSEAQVLHNRSKAFGYAVFEPRISYVADVDAAIGVMLKVGQKVRLDPKFSALILEPLEVVGVDQFTDLGVVIKGRMKTSPGEQWKVAREFNRRLKLAFDAARVEMGYTNEPADRKLITARLKP